MSLTEDLRIAGLACLLRHAQDVMLSKRRQQEEQLSVGIADFGDLLGLVVSPNISTKLNMVLTFFPDLMASARHREPQITYCFDGNAYGSIPIWRCPRLVLSLDVASGAGAERAAESVSASS
jgi:hypothetical protein